MIPCPNCQRMTRPGRACGHCAHPLPGNRLRTDLSVAAVALGLVTLAGCELFENAKKGVNQLLGGDEQIENTVVPAPGPDDVDPAPAYGGPPTVDTGGPPPPPPPPVPPSPTEDAPVPAPPMMEDQPLYGVP